MRQSDAGYLIPIKIRTPSPWIRPIRIRLVGQGAFRIDPAPKLRRGLWKCTPRRVPLYAVLCRGAVAKEGRVREILETSLLKLAIRSKSIYFSSLRVQWSCFILFILPGWWENFFFAEAPTKKCCGKKVFSSGSDEKVWLLRIYWSVTQGSDCKWNVPSLFVDLPLHYCLNLAAFFQERLTIQ